MADEYDNNDGYNSSDFKRSATQGSGGANEHQDGEVKLNEKAGEYMRELLSEKVKLNHGKFPISSKLIDTEVTRIQASGRTPSKDNKYVDVYKEKPTKVAVKVLVPNKENPKFNFVGKLLGPKGNTMKQLQEETMCRMAVLGRGSMRDRQKEEELRNSLDPKYAHLSDELHVEITALAPPAEAHARIALGLTEVKKLLIPDPAPGQEMWPMMDRDMYPSGGHPAGPPGRPPRMSAPHPGAGRPMPPKPKVHGILDRARSSMDASYSYDDPYGAPEPPMRGPPRAPDQDFYYDRAPERYYEEEPYYKEAPREYKGSAREVGTRRPQTGAAPRSAPYARSAPYQRPQSQRGGQRQTNKPSTGGGGWN